MIVIAGKHRGETGVVARALPKTDQIVIEGMNIRKRHRRVPKGQKGGIIEKPAPLHVSNVMLAVEGKRTRVRITRDGGTRTRVATRGGKKI